jgi:PET Domain
MKQLDSDKTPKVATSGAKYRDHQLTVQLPPQDLSARFCHFLPDREQLDAFEEFCRTRDTEAMDVGYIANSGAKESTVILLVNFLQIFKYL